MIHPILRCARCGEPKPSLTPERAENYFLYCSQECKDIRETEAKEQRLEQMKTHDPSTRRPRTVGELRAMGLSGKAIQTSQNDNSQEMAEPKRIEHKKGMRKCGKCGAEGHNARTCNQQKVTAEPKETIKSVVSSGTPKAIGLRTKTARTCGKCGKSGHNARTCKNR